MYFKNSYLCVYVVLSIIFNRRIVLNNLFIYLIVLYRVAFHIDETVVRYSIKQNVQSVKMF